MNKVIKISLSFLSLLIFITISSCSNNDDPKNPADVLAITINSDGTTSNGAKFVPTSDNSFYIDYVLYKIVENHIEVIGADKIEIHENVKIYSPINYKGISYNVRIIGEEAFYEQSNIKTIILPNDIIEIKESAFAFCNNLNSINLPKFLTEVPNYCFCGCHNLIYINIPSSIEIIGFGAFASCRYLDEIIISKSCKLIYPRAFRDCNINRVIIQEGSDVILGGRVFENCKISKLIIPKSFNYHPYYYKDYENGCNFYNAKIENADVYLSQWSEDELDMFFYRAEIKNLNLY